MDGGSAITDFFENEKLEYIFLADSKVEGYENLQIQNNVIHQSYLISKDFWIVRN